MSHLESLETRLSNERMRLANAKSDGERELRKVWISQLEKEVNAERIINGISLDISDDELLKQLNVD